MIIIAKCTACNDTLRIHNGWWRYCKCKKSFVDLTKDGKKYRREWLAIIKRFEDE